MLYKNHFGILAVLVLTMCLCLPVPVQGIASKVPPSISHVPNADQIALCDNFAHRFAICSSCVVMFVLVVGILLLIYFGKLHPKDIGSWKSGAGLAAVLVFVYEVIKVALGNCAS
jgi:hypothetical protein